MEWRNHAIALWTIDKKTRPLDNHKGGDDPTARTCEKCCTEIETHPWVTAREGRPNTRLSCFVSEAQLE